MIELLKNVLLERMSMASKTDGMLLNFSFDGKIKPYLLKLPYDEARVVLMYRARMFPTKMNYPNRWSESSTCVFCCMMDSDEHIFKCCGYEDICRNKHVKYEMFFNLECSIEELSVGAKVLLDINERMETMHEDKDINDNTII